MIKKLYIVAVSLIMSLNAFAQEHVQWVSMSDLPKLMKKEPRKVLVDMYTNWCGPCKMMEKNTFTNPVISKYLNENYYAVKFNAEGKEEVELHDKKFTNPNWSEARGTSSRNATHQLTGYFGITAYPTLVLLNEKLEVYQNIVGYQTPKKLEPILKYIHEEKYEDTKWEDYLKDFKSEL